MAEVSDRYVPAAGRRVFTPIYDAVNAVAMRQGQWRPRLVERALGSAAPMRILDLGCGTGEMALAIARVAPHVHLIGVDGDPLMRAAFFAVQLLDGFPNTREHARGELPAIVSRAGFSAVTVFGRYRTGGGTLDLIEALRDYRKDESLQHPCNDWRF